MPEMNKVGRTPPRIPVQRIEGDGVGFVVLPPTHEVSIQWNVPQHLTARHDNAATQNAFVGLLLWLLASPVGSEQNRFRALLRQAMDQLVRNRPASTSLYRSYCIGQPVTPNVGVGLNDDLGSAGLDRWIYRGALAPLAGRRSRLDKLPVRVLRDVALPHPIPCPRPMPAVALVGDDYGDAQYPLPALSRPMCSTRGESSIEPRIPARTRGSAKTCLANRRSEPRPFGQAYSASSDRRVSIGFMVQ